MYLSARYASSFRFVDGYFDNKAVDSFGRRQTRIVAIDALDSPGMRQYEVPCLLRYAKYNLFFMLFYEPLIVCCFIRETNKAFCGFFNPALYQDHLKRIQSIVSKSNLTHVIKFINIKKREI